VDGSEDNPDITQYFWNCLGEHRAELQAQVSA
jgi:hypothetical protein